METTVKKNHFDKSSFYFIGLLILAILGFWKSYFSKFFNGTNDYSFYFHFHATLMVTWVLLLIVQPWLIRKKKFKTHQLIGKTSYFLMPLLLLSVVLVLHSGIKNVPEQELQFAFILFPVRDFLFLFFAFSIGVWYRRNLQIHARAMILTGIVFIEPALFRLLGAILPQTSSPLGFFLGIAIIVGLVITLIVIERKQKSGRWLFPAFLVIDIIVYCLVIFQVPLSFLDPIVRAFAKLNLT